MSGKKRSEGTDRQNVNVCIGTKHVVLNTNSYSKLLTLSEIVKAHIIFFLTGPQISCFTPSNFTAKQASYVDTYCWDSLMHHEFDSDGNFEEQSLWVHKVSVNFLVDFFNIFFFFTNLTKQLLLHFSCFFTHIQHSKITICILNVDVKPSLAKSGDKFHS